jgi:hypothetical protein
LSIQQPTTGALTAVTTESQTEAGTVSTFYSPFDPMLHVDDLIVSAMSSFTNATIPLAGQDFALCETHGCPAGTFMVSDCGGADGLSDRECQLYQSCTSIEYEAAPGNATHDRDCRPITFCAERGFQLTPPTASSNRQCAQFTQCTDLGAPCPRSGTPSELRAEGCGDHPSDEYEVAPSTLTSDVVCQIYQQCNFTEHEVLGSSECVSIACASLCRASAICLGIALDAEVPVSNRTVLSNLRWNAPLQIRRPAPHLEFRPHVRFLQHIVHNTSRRRGIHDRLDGVDRRAHLWRLSGQLPADDRLCTSCCRGPGDVWRFSTKSDCVSAATLRNVRHTSASGHDRV